MFVHTRPSVAVATNFHSPSIGIAKGLFWQLIEKKGVQI
jgi:hypothetical protein